MKLVPTVIIVLLVSILVFAKNVTVMDTRLNVINILEPVSGALVRELVKLVTNVELVTPKPQPKTVSENQKLNARQIKSKIFVKKRH